MGAYLPGGPAGALPFRRLGTFYHEFVTKPPGQRNKQEESTWNTRESPICGVSWLRSSRV